MGPRLTLPWAGASGPITLHGITATPLTRRLLT